MRHLSHSQLNGWAGCGQRFYLERVARVPQEPAWALLGGSAVHVTTEARDLARHDVASVKSRDFVENFATLAADAEASSGSERATFRASGRASREWPDKENEAWWLANGPAMVNRWDTFVTSAPYDLWILPNGKPAVELEFHLPVDPDPETGEPQTEILGYIDRVMVGRDGGLCAVDLKTGASKQSSARQLGTYRVGLAHAFGVQVRTGIFWDARTGTGDVRLLNEWTYDRVNWQAVKLRQAIDQGIFLANPSNMCSSCSVNRFCPEYNPAASALVRQPWVSESEWSEAVGSEGDEAA